MFPPQQYYKDFLPRLLGRDCNILIFPAAVYGHFWHTHVCNELPENELFTCRADQVPGGFKEGCYACPGDDFLPNENFKKINK